MGQICTYAGLLPLGGKGAHFGRGEFGKHTNNRGCVRIHRMLICCLLAAAVLAPLPSHAATYTISIKDQYAPPGDANHLPRYDLARTINTPAGSTILWKNEDLTIHTVTAYYGASFASPAIDVAGTPPPSSTTFSTVYSGGTVLYRCLYHSTLDVRVSPPGCSGMCGAIHDTASDTQVPTVRTTTKNGQVFTGSVRLDGTASDNRAITRVKVRIIPVVEPPSGLLVTELFSEDASELHPCIGCYGPNAAWTVRSTPGVSTRSPYVKLPPGQYRVEAEATDPHGNVGRAAPIVIYVVQ